MKFRGLGALCALVSLLLLGTDRILGPHRHTTGPAGSVSSRRGPTFDLRVDVSQEPLFGVSD